MMNKAQGGRWLLLIFLFLIFLGTSSVFASNDASLMTSGCASSGNMGSCMASSLSGDDVDGSGGNFDLGYPVDIPAPIAKNVDGVDATSVEFQAFGGGNNLTVNPSLNLESSTAIGRIVGSIIATSNCSSKSVGLVIDGAFADVAEVTASCTFEFNAIYGYVGKPIALVVFGDNSNAYNGGDVSYPVVITITLPTDSPFFQDQYVLTVSSTNTSSTTTDSTTGATLLAQKIALSSGDTIFFSAYDLQNDAMIGYVPLRGGANEAYIETGDVLGSIAVDENNTIAGLKVSDGTLCQVSDTPALLCDLVPSTLVSGNVSQHPSGLYLAATDDVNGNGGVRIFESGNALNELGYVQAQNGEEEIETLTHDWLDATHLLVSKKYADDTYALKLYDVASLLSESTTSVSEPQWTFSTVDFIGQPVGDWGVEGSFYYLCTNDDDNITLCRDTSTAITAIGTNQLSLNTTSNFEISNPVYSPDHSTYIAFQASSASGLADDAIGVYDIADDDINFFTFGFNPQTSSDDSILALLRSDATSAIQVGVLNLGTVVPREITLNATSDSALVSVNQNRVVTATGGVPPYSFSVTSGDGEVNESTGIYTAPDVAGSATITVTDNDGTTDTVSLTILDSGAVDTSYGDAGFVLTEINGDATHFDIIEDISVDTLNRTYFAGRSWNNTDSEFNLMVGRYDSNGDLDNSYGGGDGVTISSNASYGLEANALIRDSEGSLYVGGLADDAVDEAILIAKFDSSGTLDTSFGSSGLVINDLTTGDDNIADITLDTSGRLLVAGSSQGNFKAFRYSTGGTLQVTYDSVDFGSTDELQSIALQSDGKLLGVGYSGIATRTFAITRWNTDGTLDTTFGTSGKVTADIGNASDEGYGLAIMDDGSIVVGGLKTQGTDATFVLLRYDEDGALDTTFSSDGILSVSVGDSNNAAISDLVLDSDENIIAVGSAYNGSNFDYGVIVVDSDGNLITNFDDDGILTTSIGSNHDVPRCVGLQSDGRIMVGGYSVVGTNNEISLTRIWP